MTFIIISSKKAVPLNKGPDSVLILLRYQSHNQYFVQGFKSVIVCSRTKSNDTNNLGHTVLQ